MTSLSFVFSVDNIYLGHSIEDAAELAKETFHLKLALEKLAEKAFLEDEEEEAEAARQASEESLVQKVKTVAVEKYQELVQFVLLSFSQTAKRV